MIQIEEVNGTYQRKGTDKLICDFTLKREHVFLTVDGDKASEVIVTKDGKQSEPRVLDARSQLGPREFNLWLGKLGEYRFVGDQQDFNAVLKHMWDETDPRNIYVLSQYGRIREPIELAGTWLASNGLYQNGRFLRVDDKGIVPIGKKKGVRSSLTDDGGAQYRFPDGVDDNGNKVNLAWKPKEILRNLLELYEPELVWIMIGMATAAYHYDEYRDWTNEFPQFCAYGLTERGKTKFAEFTASLLGGGKASSASGTSTAKGIDRMASSLHCIPIICNEAEVGHNQKVNAMIRRFFDGDPSKSGKKTNDDQTNARHINSMLFLTTETPPRDPSVLNRLATIDFWGVEFDDDDYTHERFVEIHHEGVTRNRNAGWLLALTGSDCEDTIRQEIAMMDDHFRAEMRTIAKREVLKEAEETGRKPREARLVNNRACKSLAVVYGAFFNSFKALNMSQALADIQDDIRDERSPEMQRLYARCEPPTVDVITSHFIDYMTKFVSLKDDDSKLKRFFEVICDWSEDEPEEFNKQFAFPQGDDGTDILLPSKIFDEVMNRDYHGQRAFAGVSALTLKKELREVFNVRAKAGYADGRRYRCSLRKIESTYGVKIHPYEEDRESARIAEEETPVPKKRGPIVAETYPGREAV